ncbi:MAG: L,D-transpeptidase family protein [Chloroflexi bacterium]|nr:LysM peptidoglycan-binding domain-containing protein [Chloroflexota bacterium]NOG64854.1 L,D-transpeptidase family protein [Chloroflexota bacterium]
MQPKPVRPSRPQVQPRQNLAPRLVYPARPAPQPAPARPTPQHPPARPSILANRNVWLMGLMGMIGLFVVMCMVLALGAGVVYGGGKILPGVHSAGVDLGGKSETEAAAAIQAAWQNEGVLLRDGDRTWRIDPTLLGIAIDAQATARAAQDYGRSEGGFRAKIKGLFGADIAPVVVIDPALAQTGLNDLAAQVNLPALNAGVQLVNGQVQPTPAQDGRVLDVQATLMALQQNPGQELADGVIDLVMMAVLPTITDSSAMVAQATILLASPLNINAYDPITNQSTYWSLSPEQWAAFLMAVSDPNSPTGLSLNMDTSLIKTFLEQQSGTLGADRYLKVDEGVASIQQAIAIMRTDPVIRVYHHDTEYTVKSGDTFSSIAYDFGVPYPWIQAANPGVPDDLSVGQTLTIPSLDEFLPLPIVPNKRIVVSISQQHVWVYENGQVIWDWVASTGISSSPTSPGVFQIQSHEEEAYAGNWNLWMPHFMGVYRPVPSSDFMNGFHGFPTRGSSQLLWTGDLGHPVTYGCILVSSDNAALLFDWAEPGVVVEIQR